MAISRHFYLVIAINTDMSEAFSDRTQFFYTPVEQATCAAFALLSFGGTFWSALPRRHQKPKGQPRSSTFQRKRRLSGFWEKTFSNSGNQKAYLSISFNDQQSLQDDFFMLVNTGKQATSVPTGLPSGSPVFWRDVAGRQTPPG